MRGVLFMALAGLLTVFVVASPKPASALPAAAALNYSHAQTDLVQVKKYYKRRYRYYRGPRYRPYRYRRPYYRPYRYYSRPYYRPYYRPYRYYRPGVNVWLSL